MTSASTMIKVSIYSLVIICIDMDLFIDGGELDLEDQDVYEEQYISDFNMEESNKHHQSSEQQ